MGALWLGLRRWERDRWGFGGGGDEASGGHLIDAEHVAKGGVRRENESLVLNGIHAEITSREMAIAPRAFTSPAFSSSASTAFSDVRQNLNSTHSADAVISLP